MQHIGSHDYAQAYTSNIDVMQKMQLMQSLSLRKKTFKCSLHSNRNRYVLAWILQFYTVTTAHLTKKRPENSSRQSVITANLFEPRLTHVDVICTLSA